MDQEAVEGPRDGAHGVLHESNPLVELGVAHHYRAADYVGVPSEVFRGRVDDRVGPELERALHHRGCERVVHGDEGLAPAGHHPRDVHDAQQRVGGRLDPDHPGLGSNGALERGEVGLVDHVVGEAEAGEHLVEEPVGAAVEVLGEDHVVPGPAVGGEQRVSCRHAAREARCEPALEFTERGLERGPGWVRGAGIVVVLHVLVGPGLHVGGGLVDRRDHRTVGGVRIEACVHRARGKARPLGEAGHRASDSSRSARVRMPAARPSMLTRTASRLSASSSTASRTPSSAAMAGNGGSITSTISAPSSAGSSMAWRSSPRSLTEPTTACGSWPDTTGSCETRCSCSSATASRTLACVSTVSRSGISPSACLRRSTSPTVNSVSRSRKPYWRIQPSLKTFERYERPVSGRITAIIAPASSTSRATSTAAWSASPHEPPARMPSVAASLRVMRKESLSETVM